MTSAEAPSIRCQRAKICSRKSRYSGVWTAATGPSPCCFGRSIVSPADFAPARSADRPDLAHGKRREVIVEHELLRVFLDQSVDPLLVAACLPRELHFMARSTLFEIPVFRSLIVACNAFPIERDSRDVKGVKSAIERLRAGNVLVVFPEGTRTRDGAFGPLKKGVRMLAERAAVPVIPVLIDGAHGVWPRSRALPGLFGRAIRFPPHWNWSRPRLKSRLPLKFAAWPWRLILEWAGSGHSRPCRSACRCWK